MSLPPLAETPVTVLMTQYAVMMRGGPRPHGIERLERAIEAMPGMQGKVLMQEFLGRGSREHRAKLLGIHRPQYYLTLSCALETLEALLRKV